MCFVNSKAVIDNATSVAQDARKTANEAYAVSIFSRWLHLFFIFIIFFASILSEIFCYSFHSIMAEFGLVGRVYNSRIIFLGPFGEFELSRVYCM